MVSLLLILDGASDACGTLAEASMPALRSGRWEWVEHLRPGVPVGSETAIAALLGWAPGGPVDRAALEAAARGIAVPEGQRAWRIDLPRGTDAAPVATAVGAHPLGGHRLLAVGPRPPEVAGADRVWPSGAVPPAGRLDERTVVIGAPGAAIGLARLLGARTVTPPGATGRPGSDLAGKRRAALAAIASGARRVVVHVGGADEASHDRDRAAKRAVLEAADRELIGPLRGTGLPLAVAVDHGCDPATGEHLAGPVPHVTWPEPAR